MTEPQIDHAKGIVDMMRAQHAFQLELQTHTFQQTPPGLRGLSGHHVQVAVGAEVVTESGAEDFQTDRLFAADGLNRIQPRRPEGGDQAGNKAHGRQDGARN